jgi:formiminotetrahydrofolate cyclodeaminase
MVSTLTLSKRKYQEHWPHVQPVLTEISRDLAEALKLIEEDARSYEAVIAAYKRPKGSEAEKKARTDAIQKAFRGALEVPFTTMKHALKGLLNAPELLKHVPKDTASDVGCALYQFQAAFQGGKLNVLINLKYIDDEEYRRRINAEIETMEADFNMGFEAGREAVMERVRGGD